MKKFFEIVVAIVVIFAIFTIPPTIFGKTCRALGLSVNGVLSFIVVSVLIYCLCNDK